MDIEKPETEKISFLCISLSSFLQRPENIDKTNLRTINKIWEMWLQPRTDHGNNHLIEGQQTSVWVVLCKLECFPLIKQPTHKFVAVAPTITL